MPADATILVVGSDQARARQMHAALAQQGWTVVTAADAAQAQSAARQHALAAAVVDDAPANGGARVIQSLRAGLATALMPAVAVTGSQTAHAELLKAGAQECLTEPVAADDLVAAVERARVITLAPALAPTDSIADPERLRALHESALLDAPRDPRLDLLTRVASALTSAPMALLSLVTADRQVFASDCGLAEPFRTSRQTPLTHSFCQWTVASGETLVVENARQHPLMRHNAAVDDLGICAYAGIPVRAKGTHIIGSFCVVDSKARRWPPAEVALLAAMASIVEVEIARRGGVTSPPADLARGVVGSLRVLAFAARRLEDGDRDEFLHLAASHVRSLEALALESAR